MLKKILLGLVVTFFLLIAVVIAFPLLFKKQLVGKVKTVINENVAAKIDFSDVDIGIISSFPDLTLSLNNLTVIGADTFKNDTLANIEEFALRMDIMSVISGGTIGIKSIRLYKPNLHFRVLQNGKANWDIAKPDTGKVPVDTTTTAFKIKLNSYEINKGNLVYDDASLGFYTKLTNLEHSGSGDFTQDIFDLFTETSADEFTMSYGGLTYFSKVKLQAKVPMEMNLPKFKFTFKENEAKLNELGLRFEGFIEMPYDDIKMDIKFAALKSDFKNFLSLVPAIYSSSFSDLTAKGKFALDGYAKGIYNDKSMPAFGIKLLVENGQFKYPALPTAVNNVQVNAAVTNPDGNLDHTQVNVSKFHVELGTEPFDMGLNVKTPISDPDIKAWMKGKLNLAEVTKIVPVEGMKLAGLMSADVQVAGKMSSIDRGRYQDFDASGNASLTNFLMESSMTAYPVAIDNALLLFNPKYVELAAFSCQLGKSDIHAEGKLENYLGYALQNESIKGKLDLHSALLDVNELMGPSSTETAPADTAAMTAIAVPGNIDFVLSSDLKKVVYDKMIIDDIKGQIVVRDQTLSFDNVAMRTLDGTVTMNGFYASKNIEQPEVGLKFGIKSMDIQKAFKTFNTVQKLAPVAEHTKGGFSMDLSFNSKLDKGMSPVMNTVNGSGNLGLEKAVVEGSTLINKLADALKYEKFKKLDIGTTSMQFNIVNGKIEVKPFDIKAYTATMNIGGTSNLDQTIDFVAKMQLPRASMGSAANGVLEGLVGKANQNGAAVNLGENVNVNALIGGTMTNPTIKLSMGDMKNTLKDVVKDIVDAKKKELEDKAKAEIDKAKAQASAKAKAEADKILADAQAKADAMKQEAAKVADKVRSEGYAQAQKLEDEAKNPFAKKAAKAAADKLRQETDKKANGIVSEANGKAEAFMNSARQQANQRLSNP